MEINMGIIKVELSLAEATQALIEFKKNRAVLFDALAKEVKAAVSQTINQLLNAEMTLFLGSPDQKCNKKNGFEERVYALKGVGSVQIRMPVDRKRKFKSEIVLPREQTDPRLKEDIAALHLAGLSTRMIEMISRRILGVKISKDTVTRSLESIREPALNWLTRPLNDRSYWALFVDGTNFRIQRRGSTEKEPTLVVLGINDSNCLSILAIEPGNKDNSDSWRAVFKSLKARGLRSEAVRVGVMDGLPGLEKTFKEEFSKSVTARCWVHSLRNALAKTPARLEFAFKQLAHKVMYASSENNARLAFIELKMAMLKDAERAVSCLEKDLESLLVHYTFEKQFWRVLRTTNPIERVNKEFKRRAKTMDSMGEQTHQVMLAFVAMRMEYGWLKRAVDNRSIDNLMHVKLNPVEQSLVQLVH